MIIFIKNIIKLKTYVTKEWSCRRKLTKNEQMEKYNFNTKDYKHLAKPVLVIGAFFEIKIFTIESINP